MDQLIADIAYLDAHRPPVQALWMLAEYVHIVREFANWTDDLKREEWRS